MCDDVVKSLNLQTLKSSSRLVPGSSFGIIKTIKMFVALETVLEYVPQSILQDDIFGRFQGTESRPWEDSSSYPSRLQGLFPRCSIDSGGCLGPKAFNTQQISIWVALVPFVDCATFDYFVFLEWTEISSQMCHQVLCLLFQTCSILVHRTEIRGTAGDTLLPIVLTKPRLHYQWLIITWINYKI